MTATILTKTAGGALVPVDQAGIDYIAPPPAIDTSKGEAQADTE